VRADRRRRLVAQRLASVRHAAGVPLAEMATVAGCHTNDVLRVESGEQAPSVTYVVAVAERFDVTTDYLLGRGDVPRPWDAVPADALPATLLRDAILLTHPDRHPPARAAQANRVTQELNALLDRKGS
jgi:transcriptional regulator with XRE-family HTH domain